MPGGPISLGISCLYLDYFTIIQLIKKYHAEKFYILLVIIVIIIIMRISIIHPVHKYLICDAMILNS